ncbi:HEAT repeat domain-containing protein [bacterium]|nr:HEAT repeat domain-containing protein [bacterium]MBU3955949.1 HEAT repeat domain-containing protein [bacterium]
MKQNYRWSLTFFLIASLCAVGFAGGAAKEKQSKSAAGVERGRLQKLSQADYTELEELMRKESRWLGKGELTPDERKRKIELCKNADEKLYKLNTKIMAEETIKKYRPEVEKNIEKLKENFDKKVLGNEEVYEFKELALARDKRAVPILTKILLEYDLKNEGEPNKLPSAEMRKLAANALGTIGDESSIPLLEKAYEKEEDKTVKGNILYAIFETKLAKLGYRVWVIPVPKNEKSIAKKCLLKILNDVDERMRYCAAWSYLSWLRPEDKDRKKILNIFKDLSNNANDIYIKEESKNSLRKLLKSK